MKAQNIFQTRRSYEAPAVERISVITEKGFAESIPGLGEHEGKWFE